MLAPRGDDFTDEQIFEWFTDEQSAYLDISSQAQERPEYDALNEMTLFRHVRGRKFGTCIAFGAARGLDIEPLAPLVERFVVVEPAHGFWRDSIGGRPAEYREPTPRGRMELPDGSADIAVCIGVLHHIPNVSDVLREAWRLLKPSGILLIREPTVSMGDQTQPRPGLTRNERGLPREWLLARLASIGFAVDEFTYCDFAPWARAMNYIGILPYQHRLTTRLDLMLGALMKWNAHYHRTSFVRKFAPASVAVVARKH
jgi:SAM-dependent methyltransferase